jgi:SCY1-like protein 2
LPNLDYIAPEFIIDKVYDYSSDMFSLGCVAYEIYTKQQLIFAENTPSMYRNQFDALATKSFSSVLPPDAVG